MPDDTEAGELLRRGLRSVPVPEPAADFDTRVRARLRRRESPWYLLWNTVRPVLMPAACSLIVSLALLKGVDTRAGLPVPAARRATNLAKDRGPDRMRSLEQALERIDRDTPSLGGFQHMERPERPEPLPRLQPHDHRGTSGRRGGASFGVQA